MVHSVFEKKLLWNNDIFIPPKCQISFLISIPWFLLCEKYKPFIFQKNLCICQRINKSKMCRLCLHTLGGFHPRPIAKSHVSLERLCFSNFSVNVFYHLFFDRAPAENRKPIGQICAVICWKKEWVWVKPMVLYVIWKLYFFPIKKPPKWCFYYII